MRFKDLTKEQITEAKQIYTNKDLTWDERMKKLMALFGKGERTVRNWCSKKLGFKERVEKEPELLKAAKKKVHDTTKKRFLITAAQNATPIHKGFFKNLLAYAEFINAEILVIPYRYHNPTSIWSDKDKKEDWWVNDVKPYLTLNRHNLNNGIAVLSDVKVQPTATKPLDGFESITGEHSCVVGHPRIELKTVETLNINKPKILFTTGACTVPNYVEGKAGKKGEFHHTIGCAIVEIKDNDVYFPRQISANKSGDFIDLFYCVKNGVITKETTVEACAMGDIHVANCDPAVTDITLNDLFKKLVPKKVFLHDVMDAYSVSYHNLDDPFKLHEQEINGTNSLAKEINDMIEWLKPFQKYDVYINKSNHDEHIDKFLRITDWRKLTTMKNAIPYMELAIATLKGEANNGAVPYIINKYYPKFKCLGHNDNVSVCGWLMSVHGHVGKKGSRGSLAQYSRATTKMLVGHSHEIGRIAGAASVGTSTFLRLDYNKGASGWINAHGIINKLGKMQHVIFFHTKNGLEYTTLG